MSKDARDKIAELIETKYGKLIMKIAFDITKDYDDAEDIKQDVVFKCTMKQETLERLQEGQLYSYICTAAKNTAINVKTKTLKEEKEREQYIAENFSVLMLDHVNFKAFEHKYGVSQDVAELLNALVPVDRSILLMKFYIGLSNAEIAEELGMTEINVKKRYQRAKIRLMSRLVEEEGDVINE